MMNWLASGNSTLCRFENRTTPNHDGYVDASDWTSSPVYGETIGTNVYALAAALPTASNPKTTPASMLHGEIVTCRVGNGSVRSSGAIKLSSVTNANPGKVTTSIPHGFANGDKVV